MKKKEQIAALEEQIERMRKSWLVIAAVAFCYGYIIGDSTQDSRDK